MAAAKNVRVVRGFAAKVPAKNVRVVRGFAAKVPTLPAPRTRTGKQIQTARGGAGVRVKGQRTKYAGKGALRVLGRADSRPNRAAGGTAG
jgi:hypothetical protein